MPSRLAFLPLSPLPSQRRRTATAAAPAAHRPAAHRPPRAAAAPSATKLANLHAYLARAGVRMPALRVGPGGVSAAADIAAGAPLVRVPRAAVLRAAGDPVGDWWLALAARLLAEVRAGAGGAWAGYIAALPEKPGGVAWACLEDGFERVAGRVRRYGLAPAVRVYWDGLRAAYERAVGDKVFGGNVTWREFVWAVGVVQSRAFRVDCVGGEVVTGGGEDEGREVAEFALLPGLDFLNHSVACRTKFRLDATADCYEISSGYGWEEGEEVFISYGGKSNSDLLFFYGFVEGNSPADAVAVESSRILLRVFTANTGKITNREKKCRLLRELGLVSDTVAYLVRSDAIDEQLLAILRVAFASEAELAGLDVNALLTPAGLRAPLSLENELLAWRAVAFECERLISRLPLVCADAAARAEELRKETICSAVWEWAAVGEGKTTGEALLVAERRHILEKTRERMQHYISVSEKLGMVTTVLLPPNQSLLSATVWEGLSPGDGTSGINTFSLD